MRACAAIVALLAACMPPVAAQGVPRLEPGVSQELAAWRTRHYRDLRYALELRLDERKGTAAGKLELRLAMARRTDLVLDWRGAPVRALRANGKPARARQEKEHLVIPRAALKAGENRVQLEFSAPVAVAGAALTRYRDREDGSSYLYSLFVPADASSVFPCIDQPDLKARFSLQLDMPRSWRAVSNAPALEETPGGARFAETEPISTYLFAFAAGPFEAIELAGRAGAPVRAPLAARARAAARAGGAAPEPRGAALLREGVRAALPLRQVRPGADPRARLRRHGARRRHFPERIRSAVSLRAEQPGPAAPCAAPLPRGLAPVVRQPGHHALVRRPLAEGRLRQLHGGEGRRGHRARAAALERVPCVEDGRLPHRRDAGHHAAQAAARQPVGGEVGLRRDRLLEGPGSAAPGRVLSRRRRVPPRRARLPASAMPTAPPTGATWCALSSAPRGATCAPGRRPG